MAHSPWQVDTVENFHGLERLIVLGVGLDEVGSAHASIQSRARLYCAMTRAQLFVVVVNKFERGGCLEFLGHVELREDHGKTDKTEVDRTAAGALMDKNKQQMSSGDPESSQACVSKSATADSSDAEESRAGGTDPTESQVNLLPHPALGAIRA